MRILLVEPTVYLTAFGGACKANRFLIEGLIERGHTCLALARSGVDKMCESKQFHEDLVDLGVEASLSPTDGTVTFNYNNVEVRTVDTYLQLCAKLEELITQFRPTWTLISEDQYCGLLETALGVSSGRIIYLSHSPLNLPFGPAALVESNLRTDLFRKVAGIITPSRFLGSYVTQWSGIEARAIPYPVYGPGPFSCYNNFDKGYVTLINPCDYKGLPVFLELARRLTDVEFAAVPTWGITDSDLSQLQELTNVRLLQPNENIDQIFAHTRILLVPSLWLETFGQVVIDAMLRGVPVIASQAGGLPEAKLGIDYTLPLEMIEQYRVRFQGGKTVLESVIPKQDVSPWESALLKLLKCPELYKSVSRSSREAALAFVGGLSVNPFEEYLTELDLAAQTSESPSFLRATKDGPPKPPAGDVNSDISAQKRALLASRLSRKNN